MLLGAEQALGFVGWAGCFRVRAFARFWGSSSALAPLVVESAGFGGVAREGMLSKVCWPALGFGFDLDRADLLGAGVDVEEDGVVSVVVAAEDTVDDAGVDGTRWVLSTTAATAAAATVAVEEERAGSAASAPSSCCWFPIVTLVPLFSLRFRVLLVLLGPSAAAAGVAVATASDSSTSTPALSALTSPEVILQESEL